MTEKIFERIFDCIPWIAVAISVFTIGNCVSESEKNERINQNMFMESCRKDNIQEHKCILLWHNYKYDGVINDPS